MEKNNTINGRAPGEIKKGLECCKPVWVDNHWKTCDVKCPYIEDVGGFCREQLMVDSIALIQRLEHSWDELFETAKQLERERDAAVADMTELMQLAQFCRHCKHLTEDGECTFDFAANKDEPWCWQWRGAQEVE